MIYSAQSAYAIRAMTRLAMIRPFGYVLLDDLCRGTDLPRHFVAKIFQQLVREGLLTSAKGRGGGFALSRRPADICLYDIVAVIDGIEQFEQCVVGLTRCDATQPCPLHDDWFTIRGEIKQYLVEMNIERMAQVLKDKLEGADTVAINVEQARLGRAGAGQ